MAMEALYIRDGNDFIPTERTCSPWDSKLLHGGAVAGLLAYAVERCDPRLDMRFVRITNDLFRPAPRVPVQVHTEVVRDGQRISIVRAYLMAEGKQVAMATALRAKIQPLNLPDYAVPSRQTPPGPEGFSVSNFLGGAASDGKLPPSMHAVVAAKVVSGFKFRGQGTAWMHIDADVVQGEPNTPLAYMGMMSDYGNGLGQIFLGGGMACINADIDLHLTRYPQANDWICLESSTQMSEEGFGVTQTRLYDENGPLGHVSQTLVVRSFSG